ncbi:protein ELYS-like isoform X2 [Pecten maximus]|uniref:protein ELYS-like isoform X2 n=1 Tax=Pecten maximus TaxID=6579 RepID=UPI001458D85D|nr:protein ELYS-like isoform X2 [Pecten maximus]
MRPGTKPHTVSPLLPYQHGTITNINAGSVIQGAPVCAGVSKDGGLSWITHGPVVEVVNTKTRNCLASWTFGAILKDTHTSIASVAPYKCNQDFKLLIGVNNSSDNGMLCVFDVGLSKVVKAIEIPHKVTCIEPVTAVGGDYVPIWALNEQLRQFYGIVAVGTEGGFVYLIDMCIDEETDYSDEVMPNRLLFITPRSRDVQQRRIQAASKGQQLCMVLDEEAQCQGEYQYRRCDGTVLKLFNTEDVRVTCLKYIPQTGNLVVGFNFGCFQLWKLHIPVLEYSSRLEVDAAPVTHIAYQEPENDPKNFCYLWMARDPSEQQDEGVSTTSLYQLAYNKKTWYSNYGAFYEELTSVSLRFELDLTSTPLTLNNKSTLSSRIVSCYTLEDPNYSTPARLGEDESFEESVHGPDLSLCVTVWESSDGQSTRDTCHLAVFDMNRWYHAQMPATVRNIGTTIDTCPYLACLSLEDAADVAAPDNIIAVHIGTERLRKFTNNSPMPPEQHFYPSSLAFEALMVTESGFVKACYLGTQRQVLASMNKMGPSILLNPKELYSLSVYMGLLPRPLDATIHTPSASEMREMLLSLALDYNMISFLIKCVQQWAAGEYVHVGCTLKFMLDWAWDKVGTVKNIIDTTCTPLYDWSGITLDHRSVQTLYQCQQKLEYLTTIFKVLLNQAAPTTEQGFLDLQNKLCALTYVTQHLQMVLWFVRVGLLPERDDADERTDQQYSYPASNLIHAYRSKRQELHKLHSDLVDSDLLMIDGLLSHMGPAVRNLWSREGGDGLYPPPSLHALLSIYLLDDVDLVAKHSVVLYLLLDLVSLYHPEHHQQFVDKISKFSKTFAVPESVVKQIQGCWLLDHSDFEESLSVMLDPMVQEEMGSWQHSRIIRALLYQGVSKMALRYLSTVQPSLKSPEDVKLKLTVLLASGLTAEALEYQRTYRDQANMHDLLYHLFLGCQQMKTMDQLLQLPLTDAEEHHLVKYLTESSEPHSQEVLVLHYLQRARYVEAIQLNEKLKQTVFTETSSKARERVAARNAIVDGFMSVLSGAQRKLIFENHNIPKKNLAQKREVKKPKPLSTTVTRCSQTRVVSQASLFLEVADKVQEVKVEEGTPEKIGGEAVGPFVCTPITPKPQSRLSLSQPVTYPKASDDSGLRNTPWRPAALSSLTPFSSSKSPSTLVSRRRSKIFGAEVLNMLETPKVQRRTPVKKHPSLSAHATPQSILKVKKFLVRSPSSQLSPSQTGLEDSNQSSVTKPFAKKLGFQDSSLPASPRTVSFIDTPKDTPSAPKPKHLQFSGAKVQRTPKGRRSPVSPPSPRSLKDRSPTPESISRSPKNYGKMDDLRRPPLHDERTSSHPMDMDDDDITFKFNTGDAEMTQEIDESTETFNTQAPLTGDVTPSSPEPAVQSSPLGGVIEGVDRLPTSPEVPTPYTSLRDTHDSPLRLRHSPLIKSLPRSPTVKLSKSPVRGRYTPKYQQYGDGPSRQTEEEEPVKEPSVMSADKEEPIEIDLTEEEDMISDDVKNESIDDRVHSASQVISSSVSPSLKTDRLESSDLESVPHLSERVHSEQSRQHSLFAEADSSNMEAGDSGAQVGQIRHVSFSTELVPSEEIEGPDETHCSSSSIDSNENANSPTEDAVPEIIPSGLVQRESKLLEIAIPAEMDSVSTPSPRKSPRLSGGSEEGDTGLQLTVTSRTPPTSPKRLSKNSSLSPKRSPKPQKEAFKDVSEQLVVEVSHPEMADSPSSPRRSPRFTPQEEDSVSPSPALSPRIPPTPPESGQDSPHKPQDRTRKTKSISPTRISTVLTPTRKSARHQKQDMSISKTRPDTNIDPVTPTRHSLRKHRESVVKTEVSEEIGPQYTTVPNVEVGELDPQDTTAPNVDSMEPTTPTRRGHSKKKSDLQIGSTSQEPVTPTRQGRSRTRPTPIVDSSSQEPVTPTRQGRSRTQPTPVVDSSSHEPTTPTRRSRRGTSHTDDNISLTEQEPVTLTRRGQSKAQPTPDVGSQVSTIPKKAVTPTRRTRQAKLSISVHETDPSPQEPTTPTRRSLPGTSDDSVTELPTPQEPTTPTRRSRRGTSNDTVAELSTPQEPTTPTRRSRRGTSSNTVTDILTPQEPTTTTRRSQSRMAVNTSTHEESEQKISTPQSSSITKAEEFVAASSFTFAEPVLMDFRQNNEVKPSTPLKSFIFSPPITRSRESFYRSQAARKRSSREMELKSETDTLSRASILLPPPPEDTPQPQPVPVKKEKKTTRKTRKKAMEEETIVLVSPIKEEQDRAPRRILTRQRAKKEDVVPTKTLRGSEPAKASRLRSKRKPVKL